MGFVIFSLVINVANFLADASGASLSILRVLRAPGFILDIVVIVFMYKFRVRLIEVAGQSRYTALLVLTALHILLDLAGFVIEIAGMLAEIFGFIWYICLLVLTCKIRCKCCGSETRQWDPPTDELYSPLYDAKFLPVGPTAAAVATVPPIAGQATVPPAPPLAGHSGVPTAKWTTHVDPESGKSCYQNAEGETTWDPPGAVPQADTSPQQPGASG